jgi:hypothetical protein
LLLVGCGECTWCAGRASITHEENDRKVVVEAQGFHDIGMGAIGAPHAFGIIYPEFHGSGYRMSLTVDDRPVVDVVREAAGDAPSDEELQALLDELEVRVSDAGDHVALRHRERWHVFHLLEAGTPFVLPASLVEGDLDLDAAPSAREMVLSFLADESAEHDRQELLWLALGAVPAGEPWDRAVLGPWPKSDKAAEYVTARFTRQPPPSAEWRSALDREARARLSEPPAEGEPPFLRARPMNALVALGGESLTWLDRHMLGVWSDVGAERRDEARDHLSGRARFGLSTPIGAERLDEAFWPELVRGARVVLAAMRPSARAELRYERRDGVWVVGATSNDEFFSVAADLELALLSLEVMGTEADQAHADEVVFAEWPAVDWIVFDDAVARRIAAAPDDEALRARVIDRARPAIAELADVRGVATVLFALRRPEADDLALRGLLRRLDAEHWFVMKDHLHRASPELERDAIAEATRIVEAAKPFEDATDADRARAAYAVELVFELQKDEAPCAELHALVELHRDARSFDELSLPDRCRPPTTTP